jgi:hypothetical protein
MIDGYTVNPYSPIADRGLQLPPLFDQTKDAENQKSHGFSLAFGENVLADPHYIEVLVDRFNYGEERWNVLGLVSGKVYLDPLFLQELQFNKGAQCHGDGKICLCCNDFFAYCVERVL